jgi:flagellin
MSNITLSAGIRANLLSLQNTAKLMQTTQNNLATGKKVNSALDNPLNFFTSQSLNTRADALSGLLDSMSNGIQTIQAANNGITSITSLVQQLQSVASQARSDTTQASVTPGVGAATDSTSTATNNTLTFNIGGGVNVSVATFSTATASTLTSNDTTKYTTDESGAGTLTIADGNGHTANVTFATADTTAAKKIQTINAALATAGSNVSATLDVTGKIELVNASGNTTTVTGTSTVAADLGFAVGTNNTSTNGSAAAKLTLAQLATAINSNAALAGKVSADVAAVGTPNAGKLEINNLQTSTTLGVTGFDGTHIDGSTGSSVTIAAATGSGISATRQSLMNQYNNLLTQINQTASDSGYNGINLLNGDALNLKFNENGTSSLTVKMVDSSNNSFSINATNLGLVSQTTNDFSTNSTLDTLATTITAALTTLQTQATGISGSLSVVQNRQDFTKQMVNTLQTGADNLVLADPNQEGANLLALQTRQSLSTTALSMASQAQQAVLRLFQ